MNLLRDGTSRITFQFLAFIFTLLFAGSALAQMDKISLYQTATTGNAYYMSQTGALAALNNGAAVPLDETDGPATPAGHRMQQKWKVKDQGPVVVSGPTFRSGAGGPTYSSESALIAAASANLQPVGSCGTPYYSASGGWTTESAFLGIPVTEKKGTSLTLGQWTGPEPARIRKMEYSS